MQVHDPVLSDGLLKGFAERCASYLNIPPDPSLMTNLPPLVAESTGHRALMP